MQTVRVAGAALSRHLIVLPRAVQFVFANTKPKTAMRTFTSRRMAPTLSCLAVRLRLVVLGMFLP